MDFQAMGKAQEVLGRRQSEGQPARETALDCSFPSTRSVDFVQTSFSRSGPVSEISSLVSGDDFDDNLLVSTPSPLVQQVLVAQTQNAVNMALGTATTAPSTATTAPSTAPLPLMAGPSTIEPIVPIVAQLGAQETPSVIQRTRPVISTEQTMQSTPGYGTPAIRCHAYYLNKAFLPIGLLWSGQSVPSYA